MSIGSPSATPIYWEIRLRSDGALIGMAHARLWIDARDQACQSCRVDPHEIDVIASDRKEGQTTVLQAKEIEMSINGRRMQSQTPDQWEQEWKAKRRKKRQKGRVSR